MTDPVLATARDDTPVFFPAGDDQLFGILTRPTVTPNGICAVHLAGKGPSIATVGRGRMSVLLARRLAAAGFHSFRLEYQGTGDSTGREWEWSVTNPRLGELRAALTWLRGQGFERMLLLGTCGGARIGLETARFTKGIVGLVLLLPPLRDSEPWRRYDTLPATHLLRRLVQPRHLAALKHKGRRRMYLDRAKSDVLATLPTKLRRKFSNGGSEGGGEQAKPDRRFQWIGPDAFHGLEQLTGEGVPVLMYFGSEDNDYRDWLEATKGPVGPLLASAGDRITVEVVDGRYYDNPSLELAPRITESILKLQLGVTAGGAGP